MRRIIKTHKPQPDCVFQLHYFPNIPVGGETVVCGDNEAADGFKRLLEDGEPRSVEGSPDIPGRGKPPENSERDATERLANLEAEAYQAGFAKGEAEGRASGLSQAQPLIDTLEGLLREMDSFRKRSRQHTEHETVRLALAVAKKILTREAGIGEDVVLNVVREALRQTEEPEKVLVRLHPEDLEILRNTSEALIELNDRSDTIALQADSGISRGGCFVETEFGEIDARIEQQFRVVEDAFQAEMLLIDPTATDDET